MNFENIAADKVNEWRNNTGMLTHAAEDTIWMGAQINRLFAMIESGELTPEEVQEDLYEWQFRTNTGTEADIIGEALEYLYERYIRPNK
jgi:hypothetical protein